MSSLNTSSTFTLFTDSSSITRTYEQLVSLHVANSLVEVLPPIPESWQLKQEWMALMNELIVGVTKQYLDTFPESSQVPIHKDRIYNEMDTYLSKFQQKIESRLIKKWPMNIEILLWEMVRSIRWWSDINEFVIGTAIDIVKNWPWAHGTKILFYTTLWNELRSSRYSTHKTILENIQKRFPNIAF